MYQVIGPVIDPKIAYDAYCNSREWKAYDGSPLPQWDLVKPEIRKAWQASVDAVQVYLHGERMKEVNSQVTYTASPFASNAEIHVIVENSQRTN